MFWDVDESTKLETTFRAPGQTIAPLGGLSARFKDTDGSCEIDERPICPQKQHFHKGFSSHVNVVGFDDAVVIANTNVLEHAYG